jgi:protein SCO1/2
MVPLRISQRCAGEIPTHTRQRASTLSFVGTLAACLSVVLSFALLVRMLTDSFEHWTFEEVRRERALQGRLGAYALEVRTSQDARHLLWSRGANEHGVMLVDFIYTTCPTVCQALGSEFSQLQRAASEYNARGQKGIELVSVSLDPVHDAAAQLAAYARLHKADDSVWTIASPVSPVDMSLNLTRLGIVVIPDGNGGFVHNGSIHVMAPKGKVLAIYDDADWREALAFATRVVQSQP